MKSIIAALLICSCVATKTFPTDTANERAWKQLYSEGKISWSEYQALLKSEKK